MTETIRLRIQGDPAGPTLLYLPGLHGDWTLLGAFRAALAGRARLIETTYPRRPGWKLNDYAAAVEEALAGHGINQCWLLAESFSSQVAWALVQRSADRSHAAPVDSCQILGLILVGGFIRHPWTWGVRFAHRVSRTVPRWMVKRACAFYGWTAARRIGATTELRAELDEFVARRTQEEDRATITSRYLVIAGNDLRSIAERTTLPVFHLSGAIDPIVPWWEVRAWLEKHCPGYRESHIVRRAGHNVLLDASAESADRILRWINDPSSADASNHSRLDPRPEKAV